MRPGVRKIVAVLGVCLVFALGMVAGGALTFRVVRQRAENLLTRRGSDLATERLARRLADRLHCDADQRARVADVLRSAHGELWEMRSDVAPRLRDIYRRAVGQVRAGLRPDQARMFDEIVAKQSERLHLDDGPVPPPTPAVPTPGAEGSPPRAFQTR